MCAGEDAHNVQTSKDWRNFRPCQYVVLLVSAQINVQSIRIVSNPTAHFSHNKLTNEYHLHNSFKHIITVNDLATHQSCLEVPFAKIHMQHLPCKCIHVTACQHCTEITNACIGCTMSTWFAASDPDHKHYRLSMLVRSIVNLRRGRVQYLSRLKGTNPEFSWDTSPLWYFAGRFSQNWQDSDKL